MRKRAVVGWLLSGLMLMISSAHAEPVLEITEWKVPYEDSLPRDPWVGGPDLIWFVGQTDDYVASLKPSTGEFRRYDLPDGAGPHTVISNEKGVWYAGNRAQHIGRLDPVSGKIEKIMLPGKGERDAHTMDFIDDGNIWFTVQHGNQIGYLDTSSRKIKLHDVPTPGARPYGLIVHKNRPWVALFGTNKLATVDAAGKVMEILLPREEARPRRLAVTKDGMVWYVDYAAGHLGRYNPNTAAIDEWKMPSGEDSRPYAMTNDGQGRLWFVETGVMPNRFIGFDPATQKFTKPFDIASGGRTVRHMVFDPRQNAIWFGTDTHTIGKAVVN
jgi:virginiamycin B lyase